MSFIGTGKIKIATYASGATFAARNFIDVGNASDFSFNFSETKKELLDYQDPAGGTAATVFTNQQQAAQTAAMAGNAGNATATPAVDPAALSGLVKSAASQEMMARLADGIQAREVAFLQELLGVLNFQNSGSSSGTKAELEKLKAQLADLRAKL